MKIVHTCYTAVIDTLTAVRVTGTLHRHVKGSPDRNRPFAVKVKDGKFKVTIRSGPSGSESEYFNIKDIVK